MFQVLVDSRFTSGNATHPESINPVCEPPRFLSGLTQPRREATMPLTYCGGRTAARHERARQFAFQRSIQSWALNRADERRPAYGFASAGYDQRHPVWRHISFSFRVLRRRRKQHYGLTTQRVQNRKHLLVCSRESAFKIDRRFTQSCSARLRRRRLCRHTLSPLPL